MFSLLSQCQRSGAEYKLGGDNENDIFRQSQQRTGAIGEGDMAKEKLIREGNEKANEAKIWHLEGEEKKRKGIEISTDL